MTLSLPPATTASRAAARAFEEYGGQAIGVQADLATFDGVENLYLAIQSAACPVAALVISAGTGIADDFARESQLADDLKLVGLNVTATVHLTKCVLADMIAHQGGKVLFASSPRAARPGPYQATNAASAAFLRSFAKALSHQLRETPVTVTALIAGPGDDAAGVARFGFAALTTKNGQFSTDTGIAIDEGSHLARQM